MRRYNGNDNVQGNWQDMTILCGATAPNQPRACPEKYVCHTKICVATHFLCQIFMSLTRERYEPKNICRFEWNLQIEYKNVWKNCMCWALTTPLRVWYLINYIFSQQEGAQCWYLSCKIWFSVTVKKPESEYITGSGLEFWDSTRTRKKSLSGYNLDDVILLWLLLFHCKRDVS